MEMTSSALRRALNLDSTKVKRQTMCQLKSLPSFTFLLLFLTCILLSGQLFTFCRAFDSEVDDEDPFTYQEGGGREGKGPKRWGKIKEEWKQCGQGKLQSPIDLVDGRVEVFSGLGKLQRDYQPAPATVLNRGHDITVKWKGGEAGHIKINATVYNLLQCHWHSPSEHTLNGSRYDLELHIVHLSSRGEIAVVAILYKYGHPDRFLSKLLDHIKAVAADHEERPLGMMNPGEIKFGSRKYYRYIGSLTVPPCTEGVVWTIVNKVRTVSREQVRALRDAVHDGFQANARPLQDLDGRNIYLYRPTPIHTP